MVVRHTSAAGEVRDGVMRGSRRRTIVHAAGSAMLAAPAQCGLSGAFVSVASAITEGVGGGEDDVLTVERPVRMSIAERGGLP
jgi:hypothetical protein